MLDIPAWVAEKNRQYGEMFALLLEICYADLGGGDDGLSPQYLRWLWSAQKGDTVVFEGHTFTAGPFSKPTKTVNSQAQIPTFDILFANVGLEVQSIVGTYIVENREGRFITVHRNHLDDPTASASEYFTIETVKTDQLHATVTCSAMAMRILRSKMPRTFITRTRYPGVMGNRTRWF